MSIAPVSLRDATVTSPRRRVVEIPRRRALSRSHRVAKRAVDIVGASLLLLVATPLILVIALAVRLTSGKHVLFTQERVGLHGRHFRMRKFRTMVHDAERMLLDLRERNQADGLLFKIKCDPRVTKLGTFLRPFALDELPQLWNVLRGDMSLVGPRPALPCEVAQYDERLRGRLEVKPGLTGLWQINGRHDLSFDDYANYDLYYVEHQSLLLDAYVLAATVPALLRRHGSY